MVGSDFSDLHQAKYIAMNLFSIIFYYFQSNSLTIQQTHLLLFLEMQPYYMVDHAKQVLLFFVQTSLSNH